MNLWWLGESRDDRGAVRKVPLCALREFFTLAERGSAEEALRYWRWRYWMRRAADSGFVRGAMGALTIYVMWQRALEWHQLHWAYSLGALTVPLCLALMVLFWRRLNAISIRRADRKFAAARPVCIACGYDLSGLGAAEDGCIVCPECGAAWRMGGSGGGGA